MTAPSPALIALREGTRVLHEDLEGRLRLATPEAGRAEYATYASALWGWLAPVEPVLWDRPLAPSLLPEERAGKADWLAQDIAAARADGFVSGQLPRLDASIALDEPARRFGCAYVIEGSMLGGQVLLRRLGARLAPWPMRYLQGYGSDGPRRWRDFLEALGAQVCTPGERAAAVDAARDTFQGLGEWLHEQGAAASAPARTASRRRA